VFGVLEAVEAKNALLYHAQAEKNNGRYASVRYISLAACFIPF
jgi:hypothetical protein